MRDSSSSTQTNHEPGEAIPENILNSVEIPKTSGELIELLKSWVDKYEYGSIVNFLKNKRINLEERINPSDSTALYIAINQGYIKDKGYIKIAKILIDAGANVNAKNYSGDTPLHWARSPEIIQSLIEKGADINAKNDFGDTPLHYALSSGSTEIAELLLELGAEVNKKNKSKTTPLCISLEKGYTKIAEIIIEKRGVNLDLGSYNGLPPLHIALSNDYIEIFETMTNKGAMLGLVAENGNSILHTAVRNGSSKIIEMIIERQFSALDYPNKQGNTPIHIAVQKDLNCEEFCERNIELLVKKGANINAKNNRKDTVLHIVAENGDEKLTRILINLGSDKEIKNEFGYTPLHTAVFNGNIETAKILIDLGASLDSRDQNGNTPLHIAIHKNFPKIVGMLINKGANINAKNNREDTVLHIAAQTGDEKLIITLINLGVDKGIKNKFDYTPLHMAVCNGNIETAKTLIDLGVNLNSLNLNRHTPLHIAIYNNFPEIVEMLIKGGADIYQKDEKNRTPLDIATPIEEYTEIINLLKKAAEPPQITIIETQNEAEGESDQLHTKPPLIEQKEQDQIKSNAHPSSNTMKEFITRIKIFVSSIISEISKSWKWISEKMRNMVNKNSDKKPANNINENNAKLPEGRKSTQTVSQEKTAGNSR